MILGQRLKRNSDDRIFHHPVGEIAATGLAETPFTVPPAQTGDLTLMALPSSATFTLAGTATGCLPMRDTRTSSTTHGR